MLKPTSDDIQFAVDHFDSSCRIFNPNSEIRTRIVRLMNTGLIRQKWICGQEVFIAYGVFAHAIASVRLSNLCENHMAVCS